jgi:hypothetical protein
LRGRLNSYARVLRGPRFNPLLNRSRVTMSFAKQVLRSRQLSDKATIF